MIADPLDPQHGYGWHRARALVPTLVVVALAVAGPALDTDHRCPADTDGPQYTCWLSEHGSG